MIGYYVHHVGSGHAHRARALAQRLGRDGVAVTGLSSLPRPAEWTGDWVTLPRDDEGDVRAVSARGHLHWAPLLHDGTRDRAAALSAWIARTRPDLVVVDVSVEVLVLTRLHGVPTVAVVLPGRRGDAPHLLGLGIADALVGFWPQSAVGMARDLPPPLEARLIAVGALSRHPVRDLPRVPRRDTRSVAVLLGSGGHEITGTDLATAADASRDWHWRVMGSDRSSWVEDPSAVLADADVVVTHAGQNAVAETAAARKPAVIVPQRRPHQEQVTTADVLSWGWPAIVCDTWPQEGWPELLERAASLDTSRWAEWCDGAAADRFAEVVRSTAHRTQSGAARR